MEVQSWQGDWGLPSVDHQCLAVLAYCKFSDVPVSVKKTNNPWKAPSGRLPALKHDTGSETSVAEIFNYLRKNNWGLDHELSSKQCAEIVAFTALVEEKLAPALAHLWWVDAKNYVELTRPWYSKVIPFPLNLYLPPKRHKDAMGYLDQICTNSLSETEREQKLYKDAKECMNLLSTKLGDKDFFFGKSPSSLDAVVFGYLAPLLKAPIPSPALQNHLKACHNLCQMCQSVLAQHFPLTPQEQEQLQKQEEEHRKQQTDSTEFPHRKRNMVIAGFVAVAAMIGYAFLSGLVEIEVTSPLTEHSKQPNTPDFNQFDKLADEGEEEYGQGGEGKEEK